MAKIKARQLDTGTTANKVVELDSNGDYPASDGSAISNVDAITLGGQPVGTTANDIVALDASSRLPNVDASQLFNVAYNPLTVNTQSGTAYTLVLTDEGKYVRMTNGAANTMTVPPNSSVVFAVGTEVVVRQAGAGTTTIVQGSGVTINTSGTLVIAAQHDTVTLIKVATDEWDLVGATA